MRCVTSWTPAPASSWGCDRGRRMKIGVVSDTHGLLRPEVLDAFAGVDHILHLGDIGDPAILDRLRELAPVTAIRGNIDGSDACASLPATEYVTLGKWNLYLLHNVQELDVDPAAAGIHAVLFGHTHKPLLEHRSSVLFFNPGAAGPRRFSLPISAGLLHLGDAAGAIRAEHVVFRV
jgi:putative phosphoesterase